MGFRQLPLALILEGVSKGWRSLEPRKGTEAGTRAGTQPGWWAGQGSGSPGCGREGGKTERRQSRSPSEGTRDQEAARPSQAKNPPGS